MTSNRFVYYLCIFQGLTLDLKNRILSIRDGDSDVSESEVKSPLPAPKFFTTQSFSSKKDKSCQRLRFDQPPPTPKGKTNSKSCSSVSRLSSTRDGSSSAQSVSFRDSKSSLSSKYDSSNKKLLYLNQCFDVICKLGSGSFGDVFKVKSKDDGKYYAVKRAKEKFAGKADRSRKLQEVQKHEKLPYHPNCVKFYSAWEEKQILYIQTELCSSSLSQYAETNHDIPEKTIWKYLIDLLQAVKHLHDHNLVHLDIKPENIFISENNICKLGDFGLVLDLSVKSDATNAIEGDPRYIAPELMDGIFTKAADIFSLGITILELASDLDLPRGEELWHRLRNLEIPQEFLEGLSSELIEVITLMMEPDYSKRLTADNVLAIETVDKVCFLENVPKVNPKSFRSSSEWSSNLSDDVFDQSTNGSFGSLHGPFSEKRLELDLLFNEHSNSSLDFSRSRLGMSTPCSFRYWDAKLHDTSGSPCLSESKKKDSPAASIFLKDSWALGKEVLSSEILWALKVVES
ncbi:membrane-associated tyrosine- and threonine-specific cdc2-inhibitory kinase [Parasteatoda tepidariorum]|uniref:membrane-associated tyrosine- and threonine-specific cdc2-inhibitory kinase n=1 Tax=Parasteatoda tepidariorum TaxID=114398 RepID=UPI0039BCE9B2